MARYPLSHGLRTWLAVVGGFSSQVSGSLVSVARSGFGPVSVMVVRHGYQFVRVVAAG